MYSKKYSNYHCKYNKEEKLEIESLKKYYLMTKQSQIAFQV